MKFKIHLVYKKKEKVIVDTLSEASYKTRAAAKTASIKYFANLKGWDIDIVQVEE